MNKISVDKLVNNIMHDYDRNRDKSISLNPKKDESFHDDSQISYEGNQTVKTVTRYSNDELFISADKNKDNMVTKDELKETISQYDTDKDGKLTARSFWDSITGKPAGELDKLNKDMPEKSRVIFRQVINNGNLNPMPPINPGFPMNPGYPKPPYSNPKFLNSRD